VINASRSITLRGSDTGTNNRALITANRNQTINGNADIVIQSGASGISGTTNAAIAVNTPGMQQTINARNITMSNAASGGIDSVAGMFATNQVINASGNVTLTGQMGDVMQESARTAVSWVRAHADRYGIDLASWDFLTGAADDVSRVVRAFGLSAVARERIVHGSLVVLVDEKGRIAERRTDLELDPERLLGSLRKLLG